MATKMLITILLQCAGIVSGILTTEEVTLSSVNVIPSSTTTLNSVFSDSFHNKDERTHQGSAMTTSLPQPEQNSEVTNNFRTSATPALQDLTSYVRHSVHTSIHVKPEAQFTSILESSPLYSTSIQLTSVALSLTSTIGTTMLHQHFNASPVSKTTTTINDQSNILQTSITNGTAIITENINVTDNKDTFSSTSSVILPTPITVNTDINSHTSNEIQHSTGATIETSTHMQIAKQSGQKTLPLVNSSNYVAMNTGELSTVSSVLKTTLPKISIEKVVTSTSSFNGTLFSSVISKSDAHVYNQSKQPSLSSSFVPSVVLPNTTRHTLPLTTDGTIIISSSLLQHSHTIRPSLSSSELFVANTSSLTTFENETGHAVVSPKAPFKNLYNFSFEVEFTGDCKSLENKQALTEIWSGLIKIIKQNSGPKETYVDPINILCGPLRLAFNVYNTPNKNLTEILQTMVKENKLDITVLVDSYQMVYKAIQIYSYIEHDFSADMFLMGLNEVDIIVIICATTVSVILVCAGLIICAREYYLKKRTRSFTLSSFMSNGSNSYDYTLQKMPRPDSSYSENGVRMKSMSDRDGQTTALLPIEEQETSVSDLHLRVNSSETGIIVGVTGTGSNKTSQHQSPESFETEDDQSGDRLCSSQEDPDKSVDNPIYYADDERFMTT